MIINRIVVAGTTIPDLFAGLPTEADSMTVRIAEIPSRITPYSFFGLTSFNFFEALPHRVP